MMATYPGVKPLFEDNEEIIRYTQTNGHQPNHACAFDPPRNSRALS